MCVSLYLSRRYALGWAALQQHFLFEWHLLPQGFLLKRLPQDCGRKRRRRGTSFTYTSLVTEKQCRVFLTFHVVILFENFPFISRFKWKNNRCSLRLIISSAKFIITPGFISLWCLLCSWQCVWLVFTQVKSTVHRMCEWRSYLPYSQVEANTCYLLYYLIMFTCGCKYLFFPIGFHVCVCVWVGV